MTRIILMFMLDIIQWSSLQTRTSWNWLGGVNCHQPEPLYFLINSDGVRPYSFLKQDLK